MTGISIEAMTVDDLAAVVAEHERYWDGRDLRRLHQPVFVHEFGGTCLVARAEDGIRGYLVGFCTPDGTGYIHLVATRDDARGAGLGRRLYGAFAERAAALGAVRLKAITSVTNDGSIAFHRALGFEVALVEGYEAGPHGARMVFRREPETGP